jgi:S1-C subfamily serine protease
MRRAAVLLAASLASCGCTRAAEVGGVRAGPPAAAPAREAEAPVLTPPAAAATVPAAAPGSREDRRTPVVRTVERVAPAVVNISTETLVRNPYYDRESQFEWYFGAPRAPAGPRERYVENSLGSGVIVDPRGYVVTNEHVLAAASRITVTFLDGRQVEAEIVGSSSEYDLAVLEMKEPGAYPYVSVDFAETLYPGETVIAIGNPFGLQSSVTTGVLSGLSRRAPGGGSAYTDFLQTDAAINPGNSGGALMTVNGDLIGINTQIDARGQNLGFAIPVARVRKVFDELVRYGEVRNVWLGLEAESLDLDTDTALRRKVPGGRGLLVLAIDPDSPASRAGLLPGDVLMQIDGRSVRDYPEYHTALSRIAVGDAVRLQVFGDGASREVVMKAETFPFGRGAELLWRGLGLAVERTPVRGGSILVITRVREGSRAHALGLPRGLALIGVDGERVETEEDLYRAVIARMQRREVVLIVTDGRATYRVPLRFA